MQYQNRRDLFLSFDQLFDAGTIQEIMQGIKDSSLLVNSHFVFMSHDPAVVNSICTRYHFMYSTKKVVSRQAERFIQQATALIVYLQKEYHLK